MGTKRIYRLDLLGAFGAAALLLTASTGVAAADVIPTIDGGCVEVSPKSFPSAEIRLLRTNPMSDGLIEGIFRLKNLEPGDPLVLRGRKKGTRLLMSQPYAMVEFKDLNQNWQTYIGVMGHDVGDEPSVITLAPGESIEIQRELVATGPLQGIRAQFRLVVPVEFLGDSICMTSTPFLFDHGRFR